MGGPTPLAGVSANRPRSGGAFSFVPAGLTAHIQYGAVSTDLITVDGATRPLYRHQTEGPARFLPSRRGLLLFDLDQFRRPATVPRSGCQSGDPRLRRLPNMIEGGNGASPGKPPGWHCLFVRVFLKLEPRPPLAGLFLAVGLDNVNWLAVARFLSTEIPCFPYTGSVFICTRWPGCPYSVWCRVNRPRTVDGTQPPIPAPN